jgi:hypothetical protein
MPLIKCFLLCSLVLGIAACGIKPKHLTAPDAESDNPSVFPRTYPTPDTKAEPASSN